MFVNRERTQTCQVFNALLFKSCSGRKGTLIQRFFLNLTGFRRMEEPGAYVSQVIYTTVIRKNYAVNQASSAICPYSALSVQ